MMPCWIFKTSYSVLVVCPAGTGSRERHRTPRARTAVPRPLHTADLGVPDARTSAAVQLGERGEWKGTLSGTGWTLPPGSGRISGKGGRGVPTLSEAFASAGRVGGGGVVFPVFGLRLHGRRFIPGMEHYHPRLRFWLRYIIERSTLNANVRGLLPTFRAFFFVFACFSVVWVLIHTLTYLCFVSIVW